MWCYRELFDIFMAYFEQAPAHSSFVAHVYTEAVARKFSIKDSLKKSQEYTGTGISFSKRLQQR